MRYDDFDNVVDSIIDEALSAPKPQPPKNSEEELKDSVE